MDLVVDTPSGRIARPLRRLGKYELFARIAAGGMAEVYLARLRGPMNFQKAVVVKVIHPQLAAQEEFLRMLFDEARLSALVRHPRVVDIYELGRADGVYFIAMEYLDGEPLSAVMSAGRKGFNLDPLSTARLIADAADGLHAAHELCSASGTPLNLVHRDVSPGNIMVLHDGSAKIVDFGVAKARGRLTISGARQFKGKLGYVAPEQLAGAPIDRRSDVYGLGVVLWEALVLQRYRTDVDGASPATYVAASPRSPCELRPDVPDDLGEVAVRALAVDPAERYQTAGEMRDAIDAVLRRAGYRRDDGAIRNYMIQVFGAQHEARQRSIRRLSAITHSGAHEIPIVALPEDDDDLEALEVVTPTSGTEATRLAHGTPAPAAAPTARRRATALVAALALVLAGIAGAVAWKYWGPGATGSAPAPAAAAPAAAPPARTAPAVVARGQVPQVEVAAEPAATPPDAASAPAEPHAAPPSRPTRKPRELYDEGAALFIQGKLSAAKDRFKQALAIDSHHAPSHRGLGLVYAAQGNRSSAVRSFKRYLQLRPNADDADAIRKRIDQLQ